MCFKTTQLQNVGLQSNLWVKQSCTLFPTVVAGSYGLYDFPCHIWRQNLGPIDILVGMNVNHDSEYGSSRHKRNTHSCGT